MRKPRRRRSPRRIRPASSAVRAVAFIDLSVAEKLGTPKLRDTQIGQVAVPLVQVEAVADEVLVRNDETDISNREIVDQSPVRAVEQRCDPERRRPPELEQLAQVVESQTG